MTGITGLHRVDPDEIDNLGVQSWSQAHRSDLRA